MKIKAKSVLTLGACALCVLSFSLCQVTFAEPAAQPTVKIGAVAQRYPWNGMVDVKVRVSGVTAEAGATLTVTAAVAGATALPATSSTPDQSAGSAPRADREPIVVATVTGVKNGEQTVSFNANDFDALKGKKLNDVKITAKAE